MAQQGTDRANTTVPRRAFLKGSAFGLGMGAWTAARGRPRASVPSEPDRAQNRLPREVWIATVSQAGLEAADPDGMVQKVLGAAESLASQKPDIVCLPETFAFWNVPAPGSIRETAESPPGRITRPFARFAREHGCYVVCPTYTRQGDRCYNAAVLFDRNGNVMGEYRKIHPTEGEIEEGMTPGPLDPPVFRTDVGLVGLQICFDIQWDDGWDALRRAGAEIIFWPSAFAGGAMVNTRAWQNRCVVVSSTQKDTAKICDVSGEEVARTGRWNPNGVCAPVNLEKAFLHTWPYVRHFRDIEAKYGRRIRLRTFHEEEWTILESRSPDVKVADVLEEFDLKTMEEHLRSAGRKQESARKP